MKVRRGDVVFLDYPYSDRTGSKVRPCLVVQCDANNLRLDDTIVVGMTSRSPRAANEPTQLLIAINTPAGRQSGLLQDSVIKCENILTIDESFIRRRIGSLPQDTMVLVDHCLKAALAIS